MSFADLTAENARLRAEVAAIRGILGNIGSSNHNNLTQPPVALEKFLKEMGISHVTGWRLRKKGVIRTVNLNGRHFIPADAIMEFNDRLSRGDFAKKFRQPGPKKVKGKEIAP